MRIAIVLLSEAHAALAGVRIRYKRIAQSLLTLGHSVDLIPIAQFSADHLPQHDLYLFSKCEDARSLLLARLLRLQGRHVGIDGFDDYFSQHHDSRHVRHREWLKDIAPYCSFFISSTPRMHEVFQSYMPDVPGHVLNDPFDAFDEEGVADLVDHKLETARSGQRVTAAWFGVGDHPSFNVGLHDLSTEAHLFTALQRRGLDVHLHILTNPRALTVRGLALLRRLDVPFTVHEWSLEAERKLLTKSLFAVIPVSAQPFSIAKSLNRSITALTTGTQVLSSAYPLYEPLDEFIYRSADNLADDVRDGRLKASRPHMQALSEKLARWGDPDHEANALAQFLSKLPSLRTGDPERWARGQGGILHGYVSPNACTSLAQSMNHLSVTLPFSEGRNSDDIRFIRRPGGIEIRVSPAAEACLDAEVRGKFRMFGNSADKSGLKAWLQDIIPDSALEAYMVAHPVAATPLLSSYSEGVAVLRQTLAQLTPDIAYFLSEKSPPFTEGPRQ